MPSARPGSRTRCYSGYSLFWMPQCAAGPSSPSEFLMWSLVFRGQRASEKLQRQIFSPHVLPLKSSITSVTCSRWIMMKVGGSFYCVFLLSAIRWQREQQCLGAGHKRRVPTLVPSRLSEMSSSGWEMEGEGFRLTRTSWALIAEGPSMEKIHFCWFAESFVKWKNDILGHKETHMSVGAVCMASSAGRLLQCWECYSMFSAGSKHTWTN